MLNSKLLELEKIHTNDNGANTMTKGLSKEKFKVCYLTVEKAILHLVKKGEIHWVGPLLYVSSKANILGVSLGMLCSVSNLNLRKKNRVISEWIEELTSIFQ